MCVYFNYFSKYKFVVLEKCAFLNRLLKQKKSSFTTLITTYPAMQNEYYSDEIQGEVTMDALFES
jgi:hypothetical protein